MTMLVSSRPVNAKVYRPKQYRVDPEKTLSLVACLANGISFDLEATFDGRTYKFEIDRQNATDLAKSLIGALGDT